jgi:hypothetical protein
VKKKKKPVNQEQSRALNDGRWKPGQSGNPKGRPPRWLCLTSLVLDKLEANNGEKAKELAEAAIKQAIDGNSSALKEIWERIDGKVPDHVVVESEADEEMEAKSLDELRILAKRR